jgi:hypothetical protein
MQALPVRPVDRGVMRGLFRNGAGGLIGARAGINRRIQARGLRSAVRGAGIIRERVFAASDRRQDGLQRIGIRPRGRQHARVELPLAARRAVAAAFQLLHLERPLGDAGAPLDHREHAHGLARRNRAFGAGLHHRVRRRGHVVRPPDRRQLELEWLIGADQRHLLHAQAHGGRIAGLGARDDKLNRLLCRHREHFLHGDGLLVAGAGRPAGGIAALSWGEAHGGKSFSV